MKAELNRYHPHKFNCDCYPALSREGEVVFFEEAKEAIEQLEHDAEVKERCYQTVLKQCVDAECKLATLTSLIDEVILYALSDELKATVNEEMQRLGV